MRRLRGAVIILGAAALAAAISSATAQNTYADNVARGPVFPNVAGTWKAEFDATVGHLKYTYDLKLGPESNYTAKITGTAVRISDTETTTNELTNGQMTLNSISFVEDLKIGDQEISVQYSGRINPLADIKTLNLTRTVGDLGSNDIVLIRQQPSQVTGKWDTEFDAQIGHLKYVYDLTQDGDKLTGKAIRTQDDQTTTTTVITNGTVSGDKISFVEPLTVAGQDQVISINYTGNVAGDELKLSRSVMDFATNDVTAKREK